MIKNTSAATWNYQQTIPVYKFALTNKAPHSMALPPKDQNPYGGIPEADDKISHLGEANIELAWQDVFGNTLTPDTPLSEIKAIIGYTDRLLDFSKWPGVGLHYSFGPQTKNPTLKIEFDFDPSSYLPSANNAYINVFYTTSAHIAKYKQIYYQIQRLDISCHATISLNQVNHEPFSYPIDCQSLRNYISSIYIFLNTTKKLLPLDVRTSSQLTLKDLADRYSVSLSDIISENSPGIQHIIQEKVQTVNAASLYASLSIPKYYIVKFGDSLTSIAEHTLKTVQNLAEKNAENALTERITLNRPHNEPNEPLNSKMSLHDIATKYFTSLISIVMVNNNLPLQPDRLFTTNKVDIRTKEGYTFETLLKKFQEQDSTIQYEDVASQNAEISNVFLSEKITISEYIVNTKSPYGNTWKSLNESWQTSIAELAKMNKNISNIYTSDTPLYLSGQDRNYTVLPHDTMKSIAYTFGITDEQLWLFNKSKTFKDDTGFIRLPGIASFNGNDLKTLYSSYVIKETDTWAHIAHLYLQTPLSLGQLNKDLAELFIENKTITVGNQSIKTEASDSFQSLLSRFASSVTLEQLIQSIQDRSDLLKSQFLIATNLPQITNDTLSLKSLSQLFLSSIEDIGISNSFLQNFLQEGKEVTYTIDQTSHTLTVGTNDTLATLLTKFQAYFSKQTLTLDAFIRQNASQSILRLGAYFLLPPQDLSLEIPLNLITYPADPIFSLTVSLNLKRNIHHVDSNFLDVHEVYQTNTSINPKIAHAPHLYGEPPSLADFALRFEQIFPGLKLTVCHDNTKLSQEARLMVVNFNKIKIQIQDEAPLFFALKPLSNKLLSANNVPIYDYISDKGLDVTPVMQNFQAVDLDQWMKTFLNAIHLFLSPDYSIPAYKQKNEDFADHKTAKELFKDLMKAKEALASKIVQNVAYIYAGENQGNIADVQEAFKQQLLGNLAEAYTIDTAVQYNVSVTSPYTDAKTAPRLVGQIMSTPYRISADAASSLESLAKNLNVAPAYLANKLQNIRSILTVGLIVTYNNNSSYTTKATDTLLSIKNHFEKNLSWQDFLAKIRYTGNLFISKAQLNITPLHLSTQSHDTFLRLANTFNMPIDQLAKANASLPGVFKEGIKLLIQQNNIVEDIVVTVSNNSLQGIAEDFNKTYHKKYTPQDIAEELSITSNILALNTQFSAIQFIPDQSSMSSKISLAAGTTKLTTLCDIQTDAYNRKQWMYPSYLISGIEHNINPTNEYESVSWLTFVRPQTIDDLDGYINANLKQLEMPLPLRGYPSLPVLIKHMATLTHKSPQSLKDLTEWSYSFMMEQMLIDQDQIILQVLLNQSSQQHFLSPENELLKALAAFIAVYPEIQSDLNFMQSPLWQTKKTACAMQALIALIKKVVEAWPQHIDKSVTPSKEPQTLSYKAEIITQKNMDQAYLDLLVMKTTNQGNPIWPDICIYDEQHQAHSLTLKQSNSTEAIYTYPKTISSLNLLRQEFVFKNLDLKVYQSAQANVAVQRNKHLTTQTTNPDFIYVTDKIQFPEALTPFLEIKDPINITSFLSNYGGESTDDTFNAGSLESLLKNIFFPHNSFSFQMFILCQISENGFQSDLPIKGITKTAFSSQTDISSFVTTLQTTLEQWRQDKGLLNQNIAYRFEIKLYSNVSKSEDKILLMVDKIILKFNKEKI